jgi:hypothetical protein
VDLTIKPAKTIRENLSYKLKQFITNENSDINNFLDFKTKPMDYYKYEILKDSSDIKDYFLILEDHKDKQDCINNLLEPKEKVHKEKDREKLLAYNKLYYQGLKSMKCTKDKIECPKCHKLINQCGLDYHVNYSNKCK